MHIQWLLAFFEISIPSLTATQDRTNHHSLTYDLAFLNWSWPCSTLCIKQLSLHDVTAVCNCRFIFQTLKFILFLYLTKQDSIIVYFLLALTEVVDTFHQMSRLQARRMHLLLGCWYQLIRHCLLYSLCKLQILLLQGRPLDVMCWFLVN